MALSRIGNFAQNNFLASQRQLLETRIAQSQVQISTGVKASTFGGYAQQSGQLVSLEATLVQNRQFVGGNDTVGRRLRDMETAVASIFDIMVEFRADLVQAQNGIVGSDPQFPANAQQMMEQIASLLNTEQEGRHLFAGSLTGTIPVDLADAGFTAPPATYPSTANTTYYQGNTQILTVRADDSLTVGYGVTADSAAFEEAVRSLHLVATNPGLAQDRFAEALRLAESAIDGLSDVRAQIGTDQATLNKANDAHRETALYTEELIGEIKFADLTEVFTRLQEDQVALQASFATIAQMRSISLLNFL